MARVVRRAGRQPWPRPFHNLRSSQESELLQDHPLHVVAKWMGHDVSIAAKHYAQVLPADFQKASGVNTDRDGIRSARSSLDATASTPSYEVVRTAALGHSALQNPTYTGAVTRGNKGQHRKQTHENKPVSPVDSVRCGFLPQQLADGEGFEPPVQLPVLQFSRLPPSSTRPPIQNRHFAPLG